jgi:hypothetical protein
MPPVFAGSPYSDSRPGSPRSNFPVKAFRYCLARCYRPASEFRPRVISPWVVGTKGDAEDPSWFPKTNWNVRMLPLNIASDTFKKENTGPPRPTLSSLYEVLEALGGIAEKRRNCTETRKSGFHQWHRRSKWLQTFGRNCFFSVLNFDGMS